MVVKVVRRASANPIATNCTCGGKMLMGIQYAKVQGRLRRTHQLVCTRCERATSEVVAKLQYDPTDRLLLEWQAMNTETGE